MSDIRERIDALRVLIVVPTYNNEATLAQVVSSVREYSDNIVVVNDGSTDSTASIIEELGVDNISYSVNRGKGYAIKASFRYALEHQYNYVLTIDSDGQHYSSDLPSFIGEIEKNPDRLIIGARNLAADNMPSKNTFANKFSNFWYRVETMQRLDDTQSGYRLYPVQKIGRTKYLSNRYEFEVEVIVRAAWKGIRVVNIPIKVYYPPQEERVSHFRPLKDFTRISVLNTVLVLISLIYYYPFMAFRSLTRKNMRSFVERNITKNKESNFKISSAIALGIMFGILPIWGFQMIAVAAVAHCLGLNKVIALVSSNISVPPMIPFILFGSYWGGALLLGGDMSIEITNITLESVSQDLLQYVVGAITLAVVAAIVAYFISYILLIIFRRRA